MNSFIEKWKTDHKYQTKIKLILYVVFFVVTSTYILSLNTLSNKNVYINDENINKNRQLGDDSIFKVPDNYSYTINIIIDEGHYLYYGQNLNGEMTITKNINNVTTNYIFKDNEYYKLDNKIYVKTTKEDVYDIVNYNYLNLDSINNYLKKSEKINNQYLVYLKDIILGNDSDDYFVIIVNGNQLNIDYAPLMRLFNSNIKKYNVDIKIEEIE